MARRFLIYPPNTPNGKLNLSSLTRKNQCLCLLNTCSSLKHLTQIHAQIITSGFHKDGFVVSELLRFCALSPFGNLNYALSILNHVPHPITSSWNHLIRAYSKSQSPRAAIVLFLDMRKHGKTPNELTFPFLFKACATLSVLKEGKQIQVQALKNGVHSNVYVQNTLIHFYGSCRKARHARKVFDEMSYRTVVSWNAIVTACVENTMFEEGILLFDEMRGSGCDPDETTMVIMLSACAELGNLSLGRWVHCQVLVKGLTINCQLGTALVNMYAKCGALRYASLIFDRMLERNVWTWSAMILGFAQHGMANEALRLFGDIKNSTIRPNYVTFLGVMCACSHAQLVDEGYRAFHDMTHIHGIKPMMTHYGAMVDILGRSGKLEEAYNFIMGMPINPDPIVWRTLLSACSIHDVNDGTGVGLKVRKRLLELEPRRGGNLVMVANMYAEAGSWDKAATVRGLMRDRGLKKMAGESCVEVGGSVHKFFSGEDNQDDSEAVYQSLDGLVLHMRTTDCDLMSFPCTF